MKKEAEKKQFYLIVVIYSLIIAAFAQFRLDILTQYFMISLGAVVMTLLYVMVEEFPLMHVSVLAGFLVSVSRFLADYLGGGSVGVFSTAYFPETFFYIVYAFLLLAYCDKKQEKLGKVTDLIALTAIDYVANMMELVLREGMQSYTFSTQMGIILVGFVRSLLVVAVVFLFRSYKMMLMKQEDVKLYRRLLLTTMDISSETVWMQDNMKLVEETMNDAYRLYSGLKESGDQEKAQKALSIATNVHEIKKQYVALVSGLRTSLERNTERSGMFVSEILSILLNNLKASANRDGVNLSYKIDCPEQLYTKKYYYMMSLFNNLFTNAVEAAEHAHAEIEVSVMEQEEKLLFTVSNRGRTIAQGQLDEIWDPGYSTKIDYETGSVGRGLGLMVVKDIVEKEFGGEISVHSSAGKTSFVFEIPKDRIGGEA